MSDSESSSSSEDEKEALDEGQVQAFEDKIAANPYDYSAHNELITFLSRGGDFDRCRQARERMTELFPLTPEMWLTWIQEERLFLTLDKERVSRTLRDLYSRAVKDYLSVQLWCQYCSDMVSIPLGNQEEIRGVFEGALTAAGLHTTLGGALWEAFREYEMALYLVMKEKEGDSDMQDMCNAQKSRVDNLFQRQISLPLKGTEAVVSEYKAWLSEHSPGTAIVPAVQRQVQAALDKLGVLMTYEESIEHSAAPHEEEYRYYIEYERKGGEPARVTCLFERAITDNPLNTVMWTEYLSYLDNMLNVKTVVLSCYSRAARNIPWVVSVWTGYMLAQQRHDLHFTHIDGTLEEALKNGFTTSTDYLALWQCYLDCHWRHVRFGKKPQNGSTTEDEIIKPMSDAFTKAVNYINQAYGEEGDPRGVLTRFMARIYAQRGAIDSCRELMNGLMESKIYNYQTEVWLDYIGIEKQWGSIESARKLYQRAYQMITDHPLLASFMEFERFHGTLEQVDNALLKCKRQQKKLDIKLAKEAKDAAEEKAKKKKGGKGADKASKGSDKTDKKKNKKEEKMDMSAPPVPEEGSMINRKRKHSGEIDKSRYPLTVFVSNLAFAATEDDLNSGFKSLGKIADIRMVRGADGKSRGYGYVEFTTREEALAALEMDRMSILGRPAYVSECLDKGRGTPAPFKYEAKLEPHKLFVSNLPQKYTEPEVLETFTKHGKVASVRMVTTKGGAFRGYCYVVYEEEEAARNAVVACADLEIAGRKIQVAISNPPKKGDKKPNMGSNTEKGEFANTSQHRRQMMSFAPRSTLVKSEEGTSTSIQAKTESALAAVPASAKQEPMDTSGTGQKDNDFFRSFYNK